MASSEFKLGDAPIEEKYREEMRHIGSALHEYFNEGDVPVEQAKTAFVLMVFNVGIGPGRCNYIATCRREDVIVLLTEQLARLKGMPDVEGRA
jgi:hypothetical protein